VSTGPHTLTGAYAADALPSGERAAFERHLEACPACAREVRELRATLARLGSAAAAAPPAALWDRVRAEAGATRQLPPLAGWESRPRHPGRGDAAAARRAGRRPGPALLAAAAALLVAVVSLAALNLGLAGRSGGRERTVDLVAAVLAAPDARRVAALPGGTGQAAVVVSRRRGQAVFEASRLAPAPAGAGGRVTRLLEGRVTGTEQVAMTVERRGGAARPTSEPVLVVDLRA